MSAPATKPASLPEKKASLIPAALAVGAALAYLVYVAVASDYNEGGILVCGMLTGVFALTVLWETRWQKVKWLLVATLAASIAASGFLFVRVGQYQSSANRIVAKHMLVSVGRALERYHVEQGALPDCPWKCMSRRLAEQGYWKTVSIPFENTKETMEFSAIPMKDGWGCRYLYENLGPGRFLLKSSGADRRFYTPDDLIYLSGQAPAVPLPPVPVFPPR